MDIETHLKRSSSYCGSQAHFRRLKLTCAKNYVSDHKSLGHVEIYASSFACSLGLVLYHISIFWNSWTRMKPFTMDSGQSLKT